MISQDAANLVDAIAEAIRSEPNQFSFEINVTGQNVVASAPGATGMSISVSGLGNTGQVVGINVNAAVQIANRAADEIITRWAESSVEALSELSAALRESEPEKSRLETLLAKTANAVGVSALKAAITVAVTRAIAAL